MGIVALSSETIKKNKRVLLKSIFTESHKSPIKTLKVIGS